MIHEKSGGGGFEGGLAFGVFRAKPQPLNRAARRARPRERRAVARACARAPGDDGPEPPLATAFLAQVEEAARDLGRLRRRVERDYDLHLVERVGDRVESLDVLVQPTAAELVRAGLPVDAAIARADARAVELRRLLGRRSR